MAALYNAGDRIIGKKIICEGENFSRPRRISTKGADNAQRIKADGNPVIAVIYKQLVWVDKKVKKEK